MSWVTIDRDRCNNCGICALRCMRCFTMEGGSISSHADENCCILCGHCVALCPADAIHHSRLDMNNFKPIDHPVHFDSDEFIRFVNQRRSHRHYRNKAVHPDDLAKLLRACATTPTGSNFQTVHVTVITNRDKIRDISDRCVDYFINLINSVEVQVNRLMNDGGALTDDLAGMLSFARRYSFMVQARDMGIDPVLYRAPAVLVFHSPPSPSTPKDDCVIAAHTVVLAAMTMGLGSCYIGLLILAFNGSQKVRNALNLPPEHIPYSALTLGYPSLNFLKTVSRKPLAIDWVY